MMVAGARYTRPAQSQTALAVDAVGIPQPTASAGQSLGAPCPSGVSGPRFLKAGTSTAPALDPRFTRPAEGGPPGGRSTGD